MYLPNIKDTQSATDAHLSQHIQVLTGSLSANAPKGTKPGRIAKDAARIATLMAEVKQPRKYRRDMIAWTDMLWELSDILASYKLAIAPLVDIAIVPRTGDLGSNYQRWDGAKC